VHVAVCLNRFSIFYPHRPKGVGLTWTEADFGILLRVEHCRSVEKLDQPKVSALLRGKLDGFSTDRLFRFLNAPGRDVEIVIRPAKHSHEAETRVV
jgi:hypothetical protein